MNLRVFSDSSHDRPPFWVVVSVLSCSDTSSFVFLQSPIAPITSSWFHGSHGLHAREPSACIAILQSFPQIPILPAAVFEGKGHFPETVLCEPSAACAAVLHLIISMRFVVDLRFFAKCEMWEKSVISSRIQVTCAWKPANPKQSNRIFSCESRANLSRSTCDSHLRCGHY